MFFFLVMFTFSGKIINIFITAWCLLWSTSENFTPYDLCHLLCLSALSPECPCFVWAMKVHPPLHVWPASDFRHPAESQAFCTWLPFSVCSYLSLHGCWHLFPWFSKMYAAAWVLPLCIMIHNVPLGQLWHHDTFLLVFHVSSIMVICSGG